jgi:hypothetical protein
MRPQTRLLAMQPQIRFANSICTHLLARLLILTVVISDTAIRNSVHDMNTLLAHLASQGLR